MFSVADTALQSGFSAQSAGVHDSRTIMLAELRQLLDACAPDATIDDYRDAVVESNVLLKQTAATRRYSFRRLRELYALDNGVVLFRALRDLWGEDQSRPLIAMLCAIARDPVLRDTSPVILRSTEGTEVTPAELSESVQQANPDRYSPLILAKIGRNVASSWQQSGHLRGRAVKVRTRTTPAPAAVVYALLLGYLCGVRGEALFSTFWCRLLDTPPETLHAQAAAAAQRGWLEYRRAGGVTDIEFAHLLRNIERADLA